MTALVFVADHRDGKESCQGEAPRPLAGRNFGHRHPTLAAAASHPSAAAVQDMGRWAS
jgi:hypothetical protein